MPTYLDEKRRRVDQFAEYLRLMGLRAHKVVKNSCFVIFDESPPEESRNPKASVAIEADCPTSRGSGPVGHRGSRGMSKRGRPRKRHSRYIQFAFMRDCFHLDLPNNTVFPREVEQIVRCRQGFYWAKHRTALRWVRSNWEDIAELNPLQKVYIYRDEESAAEDMAFILFQIWHFPVDSPLYVKAASFHTDHRFERGKRID